ncbi:odorant receptor 85c-like [Zerene cesonia]|uniref:odorant receptor 85c-like n=1 Tax=Zerene cesonia TaxID=33412 RepID=UPI0018E5635E|nr:odorant receptor 85c-like [Zerene cesonia]
MEVSQEKAKQEIDRSLNLSFFCMRYIGFSFDEPKHRIARLLQRLWFFASIVVICSHGFSEIAFIVVTFANSPRVEDVVPLFHTLGYGILSVSKVFVLWYKKRVFKQLLSELTVIWPIAPLDDEAYSIKNQSLKALRLVHRWYFAINLSGVWFYNMTPMGIYLYQIVRGEDARLGFIWASWYPFDKTHPITHVFLYVFEILAGQNCVWVMICTDLLFSGMASHIVLLLRILQGQLKSLSVSAYTEDQCYHNIINCIKLHQRLIRYCKDIGEAFSFANLVNIILSSVNICCVVFVIVLLEPMVAISNKLFLGSALIQIGILCWYGEDIIHANANIAAAAYASDWYNMSPRCRRALYFLLQRAQKPISFTAMNFTNISLVTYTGILTRSYSYFALLYTLYSEN